MAEVKNIGIQTTVDMPADKILDGALGKLDEALLIGHDKNGELYIASTSSDLRNNSWLIDIAKRQMMLMYEDLNNDL